MLRGASRFSHRHGPRLKNRVGSETRREFEVGSRPKSHPSRTARTAFPKTALFSFHPRSRSRMPENVWPVFSKAGLGATRVSTGFARASPFRFRHYQPKRAPSEGPWRQQGFSAPRNVLWTNSPRHGRGEPPQGQPKASRSWRLRGFPFSRSFRSHQDLEAPRFSTFVLDFVADFS